MESDSWIYRIIDRLIGVKNVQQLREDLKTITFEKSEKFQRWDADVQKIQKQALEAANKARDSTWDKITLGLGVVGVLLGFAPIIPSVIEIVGLTISILSAIRRTAVEILIYRDPYRLRHPDNVKFAYAWNNAMNGATSLFFIPIGMCVRRLPGSYRIALWFITDVVEENY